MVAHKLPIFVAGMIHCRTGLEAVLRKGSSAIAKLLSAPMGHRLMLRVPGAAGVVFQESKVEGVAHGDGASELCCADGVRVPAAMVLDATGHSRKLVQFDAPFDPGYQVGFRAAACLVPQQALTHMKPPSNSNSRAWQGACSILI